MKIRVLDRLLVAIAGLILIAGCAAVTAQLFFQKDVIGWVGRVLEDGAVRAWVIVVLALLLALGIYCFMVTFRHRGENDKYIMQKTENGELAISLKAMESMVLKCIEQHKEITSNAVALENQKGCLVVKIRGTVAGGVSIPLTVDALQQQIKQYVTSCSGVEVKEVQVQIESSGPDAENALFAVAAPKAPALLNSTENPEGEGTQEGETTDLSDLGGTIPGEETDKPPVDASSPVSVFSEEEKVTEVTAAAVAAAEMLKSEAPAEDDERPVHQRLFSSKEEPCVMPMPPETETAPEAKDKPEATEAKPAEAKPAEGKTAEVKPAEEKTAEVKPAEEKPAETEKKEEKRTEEKPAEPEQPEAKPAEAGSEEKKDEPEKKNGKKGWMHKWI